MILFIFIDIDIFFLYVLLFNKDKEKKGGKNDAEIFNRSTFNFYIIDFFNIIIENW